MMRWSRPEIQNSVRELFRYMTGANERHYKAMIRVMKFCVDTPKRGLTLNPDESWDGSRDFKFLIDGILDLNYATCPKTRKSVSGWVVFLCGSPVAMKSAMQKIVTLSVTEAKFVSGTQCAQTMLYVMHIVQDMQLKVRKPMTLMMDNKGAINLANNYSMGGRTKHMDVHQYFLRYLKEQGMIQTEWIEGENNCSDIFTKNLQGPLFEKHAQNFVSEMEVDE